MFLVLTALAVARTADLFVAAMLAGIYGLLCASLFVVLGAVDVAFTEAAVGAGVSTLLLITTLALTDRYEKLQLRRPLLALVLVFAAGALLIHGMLDLPPMGQDDSPAHSHVAARYLQRALYDTGVPNVVTAILASYRGFDTLGELVVIFAAGIGVFGLLARSKSAQNEAAPRRSPMHQHLILRIVARLLIPLILIFALYVQFHGDFSPGGGFQAGVIFAAAVILHVMLLGSGSRNGPADHGLMRFLTAAGVLLFGLVGVAGMLAGSAFLDYDPLGHDRLAGQHLGILLVELGVGITVAAVMIQIYWCFSARSVADGSDTR